MNFELLKSSQDQQRDGRLTIILLLFFLLLLVLVDRQKFFYKSQNTHKYMYLNAISENHLYITGDKKFTEHPASLPLCYYPFFFQPLPINNSNQELLMTIKGIGPALAETIVTHRQKVGSIMNIGDLQEIPGIGRKRASSLATELVFDTTE